MILLKLVFLLGCPLAVYLLSLKNEILARSNSEVKSPSPKMQQTPQQEMPTADSDLLLDDDFDINSLINAEEDL